MDILAVHAVAKAARDFAAAGNGPVMIETLTYRFGAHSSAGDDPSRYRTHGQEQPWFDKDPLNRLRELLTEKDLWSAEHEAELKDDYKKEFRAAIREAEGAPHQTVTEFLTNTFEEPTPNIVKQLEEAAAAEAEEK